MDVVKWSSHWQWYSCRKSNKIKIMYVQLWSDLNNSQHIWAKLKCWLWTRPSRPISWPPNILDEWPQITLDTPQIQNIQTNLSSFLKYSVWFEAVWRRNKYCVRMQRSCVKMEPRRLITFFRSFSVLSCFVVIRSSLNALLSFTFSWQLSHF